MQFQTSLQDSLHNAFNDLSGFLGVAESRGIGPIWTLGRMGTISWVILELRAQKGHASFSDPDPGVADLRMRIYGTSCVFDDLFGFATSRNRLDLDAWGMSVA